MTRPRLRAIAISTAGALALLAIGTRFRGAAETLFNLVYEARP